MRCPPPSQLLLDALPKLRAQFAAKASHDSNIFPLLTRSQQKCIDSQWKGKSKEATIPSKPAAVLVPLLCFKGQPSILFTKRASSLSRHASEISFPGGHVEAIDQSIIQTAIRETIEELAIATTTTTTKTKNLSDTTHSIQPNFVHDDDGDATTFLSSSLQVLGLATTLPSKRYMPVTPVVAVCPIHIASTAELNALFPGNPQEVERVFCLSITELLKLESSTPLGRIRAPSPMFQSPTYGTIWGLTAYIIQPLLHNLFQPVLVPEWKKMEENSNNNDEYSNSDNGIAG